MKRNLFIKISFLILVWAFNAQAQVANQNSDLQSIRPDTNDARISQKVISDAEISFKQGELNIKEGRLRQAWEDFNKSVEVILLSGINVTTNSKLRDYYFQLIDRIYKLEIASKKKSTQSEKLSFAVSPKCLGKAEISKDLSELFSKAVNSYKQGNDNETLGILRAILAREPMNSLAYLVIGKIHLRNGDIDQSISSLKTALFWENNLVEAHILLGKIYLQKGDRSQSQNYSRSALEIDPNNKRAQALSRLVENNYTNEDKKIIENDEAKVESLLRKPSQEIAFIAPFQNDDNYDLLSGDFAYVLSEVLAAPSLCVVSNEDREKILENFGFDTDETFTSATAIKLAIVSKSSLLIVGQYERLSNNIKATAKIIRVNEGRFLSEEFPDGRRITRDVAVDDSLLNLRSLQGQIAYQLLYQYDKAIPYSQSQFIGAASKIKIPVNLNIDSSSNTKIDFTTDNLLKKTTCDENVLKSLQLRNFRLGITFDEAVKILPKATVKNVISYEKQMYQSFSVATLKDIRFKDINLIQLRFFDNRLYSIEIVYDDNIKWQNLNEFAWQIENSLNLPTMKRGAYKFDGNYLYCGNYQIKVMLANSKIPAIHLFDTTVFDKIKQRRREEQNKILQQKIDEAEKKKKIEEEKKKVFKP